MKQEHVDQVWVFELQNGHHATRNFVFHDVGSVDKGQLEMKNLCHPPTENTYVFNVVPGLLDFK